MNAASPPDPRVARDPLVVAVWALVHELRGLHDGGHDEETEEAPRTGAPEGREKRG